MEEKEMIRCKLSARNKLASLSEDELLKLSDDEKEFDYFLKGLASCMNSSFVCYAYRYNDIIVEMIKRNIHRMEGNEEQTNDVYQVLSHLNEYASKSYEFRDDFTPQYEFIVSDAFGLNKFNISLKEFDKNALNVWDKMNEFKFEELKNDKYYLTTIGYLVYYHPEYVIKCEMLPQIKDTLNNINSEDFEDKKEFKKYKSVAKKTMRNLEKNAKKKVKEIQRFKSY